MLIDHVAVGIGERAIFYFPESFPFINEHIDFFYDLYDFMRILGRMAFPIYCFLLIEGFSHTRSVWKYARNLLLFALISEIPFDWALNFNHWELESNNVYWTLLIGLMMVLCLDWIDQRIRKNDQPPSGFLYFLGAMGYASITLTSMLLAEYVFRSDYGSAGIAAIAALYFLRNHPLWGFSLAVMLLALMAGSIELYALFMVIPIYFYNGKRGAQNTVIKYLFYGFYPIHMILIAAVCYGLSLPFFVYE